MTKRDEAIEAAARELRALAKGEPRWLTYNFKREAAIVAAEAALDAALALPADPPAPVEERERALVRAGIVDGYIQGDPSATPTNDEERRENLAGMTPDAECDAIIAAVDRSHPRAPTSDAAAYERAAQVCEEMASHQHGLCWTSAPHVRSQHIAAALTLDDAATRIRALAAQPTPPASDASKVRS